MSTDSRAGTPATAADLVDVEKLLAAYHDGHPDPANPAQAVAFGTSGHRGSSLLDHASTTTTSPPPRRRSSSTAPAQGTDGPLFVGADTHALSGPAWATALEVLAANGVTVLVDAAGGYTPTPAVSHAILAHNHSRAAGLADGIVITPSHNPPAGRRLQVQPAERRPRRHRRHQVDRGPRERAARREAGRRAAPLRSTRVARATSASTTSSAPTSPTCRPC